MEGVLAERASIRLVYPSNLSDEARKTFPVSRLTYSGVELTYRETPFTQKCLDAEYAKNPALYPKPINCRKSNTGLDYLRHKLKESGWLDSGRRAPFFVHPDRLVYIGIDPRLNTVRLGTVKVVERDIALGLARARTKDSGYPASPFPSADKP